MQNKGFHRGFCRDVDKSQDEAFALIHCHHYIRSHMVKKAVLGLEGRGR